MQHDEIIVSIISRNVVCTREFNLQELRQRRLRLRLRLREERDDDTLNTLNVISRRSERTQILPIITRKSRIYKCIDAS